MKPVSAASRRRGRPRFPGPAAVAGFLGLALLLALAVPGGSAFVAGSARAPAPASAASCPWLSQSLPVGRRVRMLLAHMTLADKINMVTGAGSSGPYVFYISAIQRLCVLGDIHQPDL